MAEVFILELLSAENITVQKGRERSGVQKRQKCQNCATTNAARDEMAVCAHGCQMAKFDPFLSLDCARVEGVGAQSKERKGSNFAA